MRTLSLFQEGGDMLGIFLVESKPVRSWWQFEGRGEEGETRGFVCSVLAGLVLVMMFSF